MARRKPYKSQKRGGERFTALAEWLQRSEAWRTLKPGPRALYIELKRRYTGSNNGHVTLSHREAALLLNVARNTVSPWFEELQERGFISMTQGPHLGPEGVGRTAHWRLTELPGEDMKPGSKAFMAWRQS